MNRLTKLAAVSFASLLALTSCGGGGGDGLTGNYQVTDVSALAKNINVGEGDRIDVFFETKTEFTGRPDGVELVVRLPASLGYQLGSSEIYDGSLNSRDDRSPDDIIPCADGSRFLVYSFGDSEVEDRGIDGASHLGIRFQAVGKSRDDLAIISAAAGEHQEFECGNFADEEQEAITVQ